MGGASRTVNLLADDFISSSSITTENLVLSPNALKTGWLYKLRLDVEDKNGVAAAFINLQENQPPSDGTLISTRSQGTAMSTEFQIVAQDWTDGDPPLAYRFTVQIKGQDGQPTQLQDFSPLAEYKGILPGGLDDQGGIVIVGVEVMDSLGAVSQRVTLEVTSTWPEIESEAGSYTHTTTVES